ncbi:tail fiber protein [Synechococcus phage MA10]
MSGNLRLYGATSGYSQISAPDVAGDQIFVVPSLGGEVIVSGNNQSLDLGTGDLSSATVTTTGNTAIGGDLSADRGTFSTRVRAVSGNSYAEISHADGLTMVDSNVTKANITLDGSATFARFVSSPAINCEPANRYATNTASFKQPADATNADVVLRLQHEGANDGYLLLGGGSGFTTAANATVGIKADGSATFGGGNTTLDANGDVNFGGKILTPGMSSTASAGGALKIIGNEIFRDSSARGTKENIVSLEESDSVAVTKGLRPVNYIPKGEPDGHLQIGFIAEEVLAVCPPAAITENGEAIGVAYDRLTAICISALQAALTRIEALEAEVQALKDN